MRSVEFHPDVQAEFISAAQFYERQTEGLGLDFIATVQNACERLPESPASGAPFGRRSGVFSFPLRSLGPPQVNGVDRRMAATPLVRTFGTSEKKSYRPGPV